MKLLVEHFILNMRKNRVHSSFSTYNNTCLHIRGDLLACVGSSRWWRGIKHVVETITNEPPVWWHDNSVMYDLARKELPQQHVFLLVPVAVFVSLCHLAVNRSWRVYLTGVPTRNRTSATVHIWQIKLDFGCTNSLLHREICATLRLSIEEGDTWKQVSAALKNSRRIFKM